MKIRQGFVSNSSSSCFLIAFSKMPKSVEELQIMMFGDRPGIPHPYNEAMYFDARQIAEIVYNDLIIQKPLTISQMAEEIGKSYYENMPNFDDYKVDDPNNKFAFDWDAYKKEEQKRTRAIARQIRKKFKGKKIFYFHYADEDGSLGSTMEHGNIFRKFDGVRFSRH